ncbi:MAG: hypothetical protein VX928_04750 [Pseudomonadota bacterium]|nr:hypothetical protein [Pseudomonadota bacterium]
MPVFIHIAKQQCVGAIGLEDPAFVNGRYTLAGIVGGLGLGGDIAAA